MQDSLLRGVNLYLIGMMGCGKSTVGRILATRLGYHFFDTDSLIEQAAGQPIPQVFAESGEAGFRALETQILAELSAYTRLAIATGGGIVLKSENWGYLRHGLIVWLDVAADQLYDRLRDDTSRPLLNTSNPQQTLRQLLEQRQSLYAQADAIVQVQPEDDPDRVADRVLEAIRERILPTDKAGREPADHASTELK